MIRLKYVLMIGVTMMKVTKENMLPNKCNKKEAANQGAMKIDDEDISEIIEEVYRRDKFDKEFDIGLISECEEDGSNSEDGEERRSSDVAMLRALVLKKLLVKLGAPANKIIAKVGDFNTKQRARIIIE